MRTLLAFAAALVMLAGIKSPFVVVQDKPFVYKVGSTMTYVDSRISPADGSVNKKDVTWTVAKIEGDKNYMAASSDDGKSTFLFSYADGYFNWGNVDDEGKESLGLRVFKVGAKKGDTWAPSANPNPTVNLTYVGDEEVTVPGGKFTCKKIVLDASGHFRVTFWFAEKVGMVKAMREWSLDGKEFNTSASIELQKFVEGK